MANNHQDSSTESNIVTAQSRALPIELISKIGEHLVADHLVSSEAGESEISHEITNFRVTSRLFRNATEGGPLGKFRERLRLIRDVSRRVFNGLIPKEGFPPPLYALAPETRVQGIGPIMGSIPSEQKSVVVSNVFGLEYEDEEATALYELSKHFASFGEADQRRIFARTIDIGSRADHEDPETGKDAARALVNMKGNLNSADHAQLWQKLSVNPRAMHNYADAVEELRLIASNAASVSAPDELFNKSSEAIDDDLAMLSSNTDIIIGERDPVKRLRRLHRAGASINQGYQDARKNLIESVRDRTDLCVSI